MHAKTQETAASPLCVPSCMIIVCDRTVNDDYRKVWWYTYVHPRILLSEALACGARDTSQDCITDRLPFAYTSLLTHSP